MGSVRQARVCHRLSSDSASRQTPLTKAVSFPLPGGYGTFALFMCDHRSHMKRAMRGLSSSPRVLFAFFVNQTSESIKAYILQEIILAVLWLDDDTDILSLSTHSSFNGTEITNACIVVLCVRLVCCELLIVQ